MLQYTTPPEVLLTSTQLTQIQTDAANWRTFIQHVQASGLDTPTPAHAAGAYRLCADLLKTPATPSKPGSPVKKASRRPPYPARPLQTRIAQIAPAHAPQNERIFTEVQVEGAGPCAVGYTDADELTLTFDDGATLILALPEMIRMILEQLQQSPFHDGALL